jgi:hypothetical protein
VPHVYLRTSAPCLKEAKTGQVGSSYPKKQTITYSGLELWHKWTEFILLTVGSDSFPLTEELDERSRK